MSHFSSFNAQFIIFESRFYLPSPITISVSCYHAITQLSASHYKFIATNEFGDSFDGYMACLGILGGNYPFLLP